MKELTVKYGCNPHQKPSSLFMKEGELPIQVLNGTPSYINFMDALNAWQLVKELKEATGLPAAASFKHVSPAGAAVAVPMSDSLKKSCRVFGKELTPVAIAYARARGADRVSSFGDFVAVSNVVDLSLATLLLKEVSDGIVAPGFEPAAFELLKAKKKGAYVMMQMDSTYVPVATEARDVFGITIEQLRNNAVFNAESFKHIVTKAKDIPESAIRDMLIANITLKYTQSNSICFAYNGQVIGVGAGQQSRIHCTRLAAGKADMWMLRQHPRVLDLPFIDGLANPVLDNAVDGYLRDDLTDVEYLEWEKLFKSVPHKLKKHDKHEWIHGFDGIVYASDAFIPFCDNVDRAAESAVKYIVQPGGSVKDADVISAADGYDMLMCYTGVRLFHH
jgi:phosphoribosylaminoimidazolecarboxamide formyltransferase/IMP cyclohydrolase